MKRGEAAYTPLTVVLDEYKTLRRVCSTSAPDVFITLSDIGRELGMRLVVLSTGGGVDSLGIKGMSDTKDPHIVIEVDKQHRATLEWDATSYQLNTHNVTNTTACIPELRWWSAPKAPASVPMPREAVSSVSPASTNKVSTPDADRLLRSLVERELVPACDDSDVLPVGNQFPQSGSPVPADTNAVPDDNDDVIRLLVERGFSANKIADLFGSKRERTLEKIRRAKENA